MASSTSCKIQIMSDLHLETHPSYDYDFEKTAPYLALLGDIGHVANEQLFKFFVRQLLRYRVVFFLLGNHEPYHMSMDSCKTRMHRFVRTAQRLRENDSTIGEFVFLDQTRFDLSDGVTILGCTLWTRVLPEQAANIQSRMVDYRDIVNWDVSDHVDAHLSDLAWLNEQVKDIASTSKRIVIFTHHSPSDDHRAKDPRYGASDVSSGFHTDLSSELCWTNASTVLWAFGHTHYSCDFVDDLSKRVVANQKGYYLIPQRAFRPGKYVEIDPSTPLEEATSSSITLST